MDIEILVRSADSSIWITRRDTNLRADMRLTGTAEFGALADALIQGVDDEIKHIEENRKG